MDIGEIGQIGRDDPVGDAPFVRTRILVLSLITSLGENEDVIPGLLPALFKASVDLSNVLTMKSNKSRSHLLSQRILATMAKMNLASDVQTKALTVLLLDNVMVSEEKWALYLKGPLSKLNLYLRGKMPAPDRAKAVQVSRTVYKTLEIIL